MGERGGDDGTKLRSCEATVVNLSTIANGLQFGLVPLVQLLACVLHLSVLPFVLSCLTLLILSADRM